MRVELRTRWQWVSAERLTTGAGADVAAALSSDGTRLVFTQSENPSRLWVFPFDPVAHRVGFRRGPAVTRGRCERVNAADLSPDGRIVAYSLRRAGQRP